LTYTPGGYILYYMMHKDIKNKAERRLKIIEGQVRGLREMVEKEKYCVDIITQTSAVKKALSGVEDLILENHLSTHVVHQFKHGDETKPVKEILKIYRLKRK
jgi:CsoR family transcriptional regulator, copper-sensing transcriptional repressor